jgi:hypothetical protein
VVAAGSPEVVHALRITDGVPTGEALERTENNGSAFRFS